MNIEAGHLLLLLNWMSPAFPIGGFAYSHGLEWAIEDGQVKTAADVKSWIEDVITRGSGWNDSVLFAQVWDGDAGELNELALALSGSKERYLETTQLGAAFQTAASVLNTSVIPAQAGTHGATSTTLNDCAGCTMGPGFPRDDGILDIAYPIAAGLACKAMGIGKSHALLAYLQGFSNALVSVAVRLIPLGQTHGLETIRDLIPVITATAARAGNATLDDLGSAAIGSDIAAMKHETQYSRVFRT